MELSPIRRSLRFVRETLRRFRGEQQGQIAIVAALSMTTLVTAVGGGIDLSRAFMARQQLSEVATLACQYANRPSVVQTIAPSYVGANGAATYQAAVNTFISQALNTQRLPWMQTVAAPFAFTQNGPADVTVAASVPTMFMKIINVNQLSVGATSHCYDTTAVLNPTKPNGNSPNLISEGFETPNCYSFYNFCFIQPNGTKGSAPPTYTSTFPPSAGYTGSSGTQWYIMGYCLETDQVGTIKSTVPQGSFSAELDCDNGSGSAGNSSISAKTYMAAGSYELRYNYVSRVDYPDYDPVYICGSTASDLSWANDTNASDGGASSVLRTNQINVYLDLNTTGSAPLHTTIDKTQQLAGSNLIDMCVHSPNWIERSVRIKINTPGFYWLSFAADGTSDSYGGQIDNIRLCIGSCTTTLQDNFPSSWLAANNGGVNKVLFEDSFESPVYTQDASTTIPHTKSGNMVNSAGSTVSSSTCTYISAALPGWPCQSAASTLVTWAPGYTKGWATGPVNEIVMNIQGAYQGSQYPALVGWNGFSSGNPSRNRAISRPFLLDPGYYQVSYDYVSNVDYSPGGDYGTLCQTAPGSGSLFTSTPNQTGTIRWSTATTGDGTANIVGVYMSHGQLVSTPVNSGTTLGSTTQYNNPDATITTTPTAPPDNVNWASYNASVNNPVLDVCAYVDSFRWVPRSVSVEITKPGIYWLTFSANGAISNGNGGGIDDVKLTALGSLYMSSPPTTALTAIPVPSPQPNSTYNNNGAFSGFDIVADPLTPPAASP